MEPDVGVVDMVEDVDEPERGFTTTAPVSTEGVCFLAATVGDISVVCVLDNKSSLSLSSDMASRLSP